MPEKFKDRLYKFITDYLAQYTHSPAFLEMTEAMGISPRSKSLITRTLRILEKEGRVKLMKSGRRLLISLPEKKLRIMGRISAGSPIEAIEDPQVLDFTERLLGEGHFVLEVHGDSMRDEGILNGDFIICRQADTARENDIVVALIDQETATLKRISYRLRDFITLIPENPQFSSQVYTPERIHIQGVYVGILRLKI